MAILKNLVVNGGSRFLNKSYFQDVAITGTATLSSLALSGALTVNGATTLTGATTINNSLSVTGVATLKTPRMENGIEIYHATPFIDFHYNSDNADYTSRIIEASRGTLSISGNLSVISALSAQTGVITTLNSTNVNVTNNLRANHYDLQTVAQLGGSFYVSPTVKFPNSGTTLAVAKSGSTLTLTITDSSITSTTMAGVVWTTNSGVKVSGTINGVVTGTMDGTVSSINTSSHTLTLSVSGENSGNVQASPSGSPYNASQFKDLSVMLYTRKQDGTSKMINTASGAIASFTDGGNNVPIKQLVVDIEPAQDLHGQANPYPAGGGKNLLPITITGETTVNGLKRTPVFDADGNLQYILLNGNCTAQSDIIISGTWGSSDTLFTLPAGTYTFSKGVNNSNFAFIMRVGSTNIISTYSTPYNFTLNANTNVSFCFFRCSAGQYDNVKVYPQIEVGSSASAYAPYSNICPISGHTQAVVTRTGVNLADMIYDHSVPSINTGALVSYDGARSKYINVKPNTTYTATFGASVFNAIVEYTADKTFVKATSNASTITTTATTAYVMLRCDGATSIETIPNCQFELGSTASTYEPYNGQTYTIDLDSTRYGGTLDVTTGVLTVTHIYTALSGITGTATSGNIRRWYTAPIAGRIPEITMCDSLRVGEGYIYNQTGYISISTDNRIVVTPQWAQDITTVSAFETALAQNPVNYVTNLETPQTVQLSATEVRTLSGYNNIWSNTGDTNVIYESSQVDSTNNYNVGIWMNCYDQANSSSTIRVYNGSSRWPNVFLGNMTNADLPRVNGNEPYGYGLYSDNVFLRGIISATGGLIGNWTIGTTGMFYNSDAPGSTSITMIPGGTTASTTSIGGSSGSKQWIFTGKDLFGIDTNGKLYATSAEISGKITANTGYIGGTSGWTIAAQQLSSGVIGVDNSLFLATKNLGSNTSIAGRSGSDWRLTVGSHFGVTNTGVLYANSVNISGAITATSLTLGTGVKISESQVDGLTTDLGALTNKVNAVYGTCNTSSSTQIKVVTCSGFTLYDGALINVKFTNSNIFYTEKIIMNINSTGNKDVYVSGAITSTINTLVWGSGAEILFKYTGGVYTVVDNPKTWFGSCSNPATNTTKVVSIPGCVICKGTIVKVKMDYRNTVNCGLNVSDTGNFSIHVKTGNDYPTVANGYSWTDGSTAEFVFTGNFWRLSSPDIESAKTATNYLYFDSNNGLVVSQTGVANTGYNTQITNSGMNIRNGSTVLANYSSSITLGEIANGVTRVKIDSDSFDVIYRDDLGVDATVATFGTTATIGKMSARGVSINSNGFKFNNEGKTSFYVGVNYRDGLQLFLSDFCPISSNPQTIEVNSKEYSLMTTLPSNINVIQVGSSLHLIDEDSDEFIVSADSWNYKDWIIMNGKLWINSAEVDGGDSYACYIYSRNGYVTDPYCVIGRSEYSTQNPAGNMSLSQGYGCIAGGAYSTSVGWHNLSSGLASFSSGSQSKAYGKNSFAGGFASTTHFDNSLAFGYQSLAFGQNSVAFGDQSGRTSDSFEIRVTSVNSSTGEITCTINRDADYFEMTLYDTSILVTMDNKYVFEYVEITSGSGTSTVTFTCYSRYDTPTVNTYLYVLIDPPGSYGEGCLSVNSCCAGNILSTAFGKGTAAPPTGLAIGMYNIPEANVLFSVGNGTDYDDRNNAMTVDMFGNVKASGDFANGDGITLNKIKDTMQFVGVQWVTATLSAIASGAAGYATTTFTPPSGATNHIVIPISTYQYNICTGNPEINGNTIRVGVTNISSGSHSCAVRMCILSYRWVRASS